MATYRIDLVVPDDKVADLHDALRLRFGKKGDGSDYSNVEVQNLYRQFVRDDLKKAYAVWVAAQPRDINIT